MTNADGFLSIVLHAHLPLLVHPRKAELKLELPYYEWCSDVLLPLLETLVRLEADGVEAPLTLSLSSTLLAMLDDEPLKKRLDRYLTQRIGLSRREQNRANERPAFASVAQWHQRRFEGLSNAFNQTYKRDLLGALADLHRRGRLELIATVGSHPVVPLLSGREISGAHVRLAVDDFTRRFAEPPTGMWLPECAYSPGVEDLFAAHGIRYTIVSSRAVEAADPSPLMGASRPIAATSGLAFFPRDEKAAQEVADVTNRAGGGPFLDRRLTADLDHVGGELRGFSPTSDWCRDTLCSFTRPDRYGLRRCYDPDEAAVHARQSAHRFVDNRRRTLADQSGPVPSPPIALLAVDSQVFGRWWLEGPIFLDEVIRHSVATGVAMTTPSRYLDSCRLLQISQPAPSTWGRRGSLETWLDEDTAWIYRHLHHAEQRLLESLRSGQTQRDPLRSKALRQAAREILTARTSDWAALIGRGRAAGYAIERVIDHLSTANHLLASIESGAIDAELVQERERRCSIFPQLALSAFC